MTNKHAIVEFSEQIPGNAALPLERGVQYVNPIRHMGDLGGLPDSVQQAINNIKAAESVSEKSLIAHTFANNYIVPEQQFSKELERKVSFSELANDPRGDCDDYMNFKRDLLLLGGVNPRDIFSVGGLMSYDIEVAGKDASFSEGHGFLVVKDCEQYILLDNNLAETPVLDPKNPTTQSTLYVPPHLEEQFSTVPIATIELKYISQIVDGRGTPFESNEAEKMMIDHMIDIGRISREGLPPAECFNECAAPPDRLEENSVKIPASIQENNGSPENDLQTPKSSNDDHGMKL